MPGTTRRTERTDEDPRQLTARFLASYTDVEGLAEDIGYSYLQPVPLEIADALLARRPWSSDTVSGLLKAVLKREEPAFKLVRADYGSKLVSEWNWATRVRNDLAHSTGQWISGAPGPHPNAGAGARYPDRWELAPRNSRHSLRELTDPQTVEGCWSMCIELASSYWP